MNNLKKYLTCLFMAMVLLIFQSCQQTNEDLIPVLDSKIISGKILAPDGATPIAGATVYVTEDGKFSTITKVADIDCGIPEGSYVTYTCTSGDGSFSLDISNLNTKIFDLLVAKGSFTMKVKVDLGNSNGIDLGEVTLPSEPDLGAGNFAVVTGSFDRMQDILAKLGMGEIDEFDPILIPGTEKFDLYSGDFNFNEGYPEFFELFDEDTQTGQPRIFDYDIVFINCGNQYEIEFFEDETKMALLKEYVSSGGKIYVTDQSYDFVEQLFPEFVDFYGSNDISPENVEDLNAAEVGDGGITSHSNIEDTQLTNWLNSVECEGGPCLNSDGTVTIKGFLIAWAVINEIHSSKLLNVKVWTTGPVSWFDWFTLESGSGSIPLTVTFNYGQGAVLYTSYHTEENEPVSGFWPQERILQYLVFEL